MSFLTGNEYICATCGYMTLTLQELKDHRKADHKKPPKKTPERTKHKPHLCLRCLNSFPSVALLIMHRRDHRK